MLIQFNRDKTHVLFTSENDSDYKQLKAFPGLLKVEMLDGCPAILPIAHNLVQRYTLASKTKASIRLSKELSDWLEQPFQLNPLPSNFYYHTPPKDFQDISLRFLYTLGSAGLLLDPGMGKTKVVLDYIFLKKFNLSMVVCPAALLFVWEDEIEKHRPELGYHVVRTTDWVRELAAIRALPPNSVIIINYTKVVILKHRIKELKIDFMHLDEFLIKDPKTDRTKTMLEISKQVPYKCGGSGTLINNSPLDGFSPVRYLQPSLVGWNYGTFQERYCVMVDMKRTDGFQSRVPVAYKNLAEIRSILDTCCIIMTKEEWLKLPPKHVHDIFVQMGPDQKEAYYQLLKNYYLSFRGKDFLVDNPLVMMSKLYQISQGFLYYTDPKEELGEIVEVSDEFLAVDKKKSKPREALYFDSQPKVEALRNLLTTTLKGKKAIIWFNLTGEFKLIKDLLDELGQSFISIQGGDKKIGEKVRTFNKRPDIPWLVCQAKSVNYGITVMGSKREDLEKEGFDFFPDLDPSVCNEVFFSINFSLEVYSQQMDRIHRLGQEFECHYYRIFCNSPVEHKTREAIEGKLCIRKEMLVDVAHSVLLQTDPDVDPLPLVPT